MLDPLAKVFIPCISLVECSLDSGTFLLNPLHTIKLSSHFRWGKSVGRDFGENGGCWFISPIYGMYTT